MDPQEEYYDPRDGALEVYQQVQQLEPVLSPLPREASNPPAGSITPHRRRSLPHPGAELLERCRGDSEQPFFRDVPVWENIVHETLAINTLAMQRTKVESLDEAMDMLNEVYSKLAQPETEREFEDPQTLDLLRATTLSNLGVTACRRGQPRQALSHFEGARQIEEKWNIASPAVALNTAAAYNTLKMYDKATAAALETISMLRTLEQQKKLRKQEKHMRRQPPKMHSMLSGPNDPFDSPSGTSPKAGKTSKREDEAMLAAAASAKIASSKNSVLWAAAWHNLGVAQINCAANSSKDESEYSNALSIFENAMRVTHEKLGEDHPMSKNVTETFRVVRRQLRQCGAFRPHRSMKHAPLPPVDPREQELMDSLVDPVDGESKARALERQKRLLTITFRGEVTGGKKLVERIDPAPYPGAVEEGFKQKNKREARHRRAKPLPFNRTLVAATKIYGNPHPLLHAGVGASDLDWAAGGVPEQPSQLRSDPSTGRRHCSPPKPKKKGKKTKKQRRQAKREQAGRDGRRGNSFSSSDDDSAEGAGGGRGGGGGFQQGGPMMGGGPQRGGGDGTSGAGPQQRYAHSAGGGPRMTHRLAPLPHSSEGQRGQEGMYSSVVRPPAGNTNEEHPLHPFDKTRTYRGDALSASIEEKVERGSSEPTYLSVEMPMEDPIASFDYEIGLGAPPQGPDGEVEAGRVGGERAEYRVSGGSGVPQLSPDTNQAFAPAATDGISPLGFAMPATLQTGTEVSAAKNMWAQQVQQKEALQAQEQKQQAQQRLQQQQAFQDQQQAQQQQQQQQEVVRTPKRPPGSPGPLLPLPGATTDPALVYEQSKLLLLAQPPITASLTTQYYQVALDAPARTRMPSAVGSSGAKEVTHLPPVNQAPLQSPSSQLGLPNTVDGANERPTPPIVEGKGFFAESEAQGGPNELFSAMWVVADSSVYLRGSKRQVEKPGSHCTCTVLHVGEDGTPAPHFPDPASLSASPKPIMIVDSDSQSSVSVLEGPRRPQMMANVK